MPAPQCGSPDPRWTRGGYLPAMTTLLRIAQEMRARDVVVHADLGAAQAGEVFLSHVSASAIEAVCLLMIDSLDLETLMKVIPRRRFVGVDDRALGNAATDEWGGLAFGIEHRRD